MCAICGIVNLSPEPVQPAILRKMALAQRHRGPDDEGYLLATLRGAKPPIIAGGPDTPSSVFESRLSYNPKQKIEAVAPNADFQIGLAHRRLNIIDLTAAGHQPISNEDGTIWLIHNGEVYNFLPIREELVRKGHLFSSHTDTEVIIHAYEEWGMDALGRFNGMWAFAILDQRKGKIFLARDRFGVKPCYYYYDGAKFLFSSEIKGLLASGLIRPEPDWEIVKNYLEAGFKNYRRRTFFQDVHEISAGSFLELDLQKQTVRKKDYYRLPLQSQKIDDGQAIEQFRELFTDAVRIRLLSDVPLGSCLSGGLDSSSIVCVLNRLMKTEGVKLPEDTVLKTFSARYPGSRHDEGYYIKLVKQQTQAEAHTVFPDPQDLEKEVSNLIWHQDEPFATTSIYAQWCVFRLARKMGVTVTLDGQGSDETLAGYLGYRFDYLAQLLRRFRMGAYLKEVKDSYLLNEPLGKMVEKSLRIAFLKGFHHKWLNLIHHGKVHRENNSQIKNLFLRALHRNFTGSLAILLRYEDRNSMAHSIETRLPFLDYRVVEFVFSLPDRLKIRKGVTKWVLREAMQEILPEEIRTRRDKIGFSTPEDLWFRTGLSKMAEEIFHSESFQERSCFDHRQLSANLAQHLSGEKNKSELLWRHLNLELWLRRFVDGNGLKL